MKKLSRKKRRRLDKIMAPIWEISAKIKPEERHRNLVLQDRERFRR